MTLELERILAFFRLSQKTNSQRQRLPTLRRSYMHYLRNVDESIGGWAENRRKICQATATLTKSPLARSL